MWDRSALLSHEGWVDFYGVLINPNAAAYFFCTLLGKVVNCTL